MGGCVVPPGTAAMCQTGGEEGKGSEWAGERERESNGGRVREKVVEGRERKKKGGGIEALPGCPSAVSQ